MTYTKISLYLANGIPEALSNLWYGSDSAVVEIRDAVEDAKNGKDLLNRMTLSCNDLGSLCRAAEDKRYSLRNNEETLKLKQILFFRTKAEMDAYHDMSRKPEDWTEAEIEQQRNRFCSVWQVIEEAELVDEYEAWKEANPNA